jgi:tRNA threonylcarbamoyladenosine biosynthesis protein TsaB
MILALDTSTPITELLLTDRSGKILKQIKVEVGNQLSEQLLQIIEDALKDASLKLNGLTGLIFVSGPGSFTGLRIGASTINALAYSLNIPVIGIPMVPDWLIKGLARLNNMEDDKIVKLEYGAEAHITKQRK